MNDKELLELAAKAADIGGHSGTYYGELVFMRDGHTPWNPLTDDGDALRLAVKLGISFSDDYTYPEGNRYVRVGCIFGDTLYGDQELCGGDPYAATRRAIVRAAAEIGRTM